MKFGQIASHIVVLVAGLGIGYYISKPPAPPAAVTPPVAAPWAIPSPGAMYAEQHYPNIHKYLGKAPFYTVTTATDGSVIFVD